MRSKEKREDYVQKIRQPRNEFCCWKGLVDVQIEDRPEERRDGLLDRVLLYLYSRLQDLWVYEQARQGVCLTKNQARLNSDVSSPSQSQELNCLSYYGDVCLFQKSLNMTLRQDKPRIERSEKTEQVVMQPAVSGAQPFN